MPGVHVGLLHSGVGPSGSVERARSFARCGVGRYAIYHVTDLAVRAGVCAPCGRGDRQGPAVGATMEVFDRLWSPAVGALLAFSVQPCHGVLGSTQVSHPWLARLGFGPTGVLVVGVSAVSVASRVVGPSYAHLWQAWGNGQPCCQLALWGGCVSEQMTGRFRCDAPTLPGRFLQCWQQVLEVHTKGWHDTHLDHVFVKLFGLCALAVSMAGSSSHGCHCFTAQ